MSKDEESIHTGSAELKTVKAGCGIRFDPDTLNEESGFDFSGAKALALDAEASEEEIIEQPPSSK